MGGERSVEIGEGSVICGKFTIEKELGRGGMGTVFLARHARLGQTFALKFLNDGAFADASASARFEQEARAASRLRSPFVVRVFDVDVTPSGQLFLVMEHLVGHDLAAELHARGGRVPVTEGVDWVLQVCSAMTEAHALGIVHRDLKPANLFLLDEGRTLKILDFGISKIGLGAGLTSTSALVGTPHFMAPEQFLGLPIGPHTDVWALGVILYHALTGAYPFPATTLAEASYAVVHRPPVPPRDLVALPPALEPAILGAISQESARRTTSAAAFAEAIRPFGSGRDILAEAVRATVARPDLTPPSTRRVGTTARTPAGRVRIPVDSAPRTLPDDTSAVVPSTVLAPRTEGRVIPVGSEPRAQREPSMPLQVDQTVVPVAQASAATPPRLSSRRTAGIIAAMVLLASTPLGLFAMRAVASSAATASATSVASVEVPITSVDPQSPVVPPTVTSTPAEPLGSTPVALPLPSSVPSPDPSASARAPSSSSRGAGVRQPRPSSSRSPEPSTSGSALPLHM